MGGGKAWFITESSRSLLIDCLLTTTSVVIRQAVPELTKIDKDLKLASYVEELSVRRVNICPNGWLYLSAY
jgi:hypothetical protein